MIKREKTRLGHIIAVIVGLLLAAVVIMQLNASIIENACLEHGGRYNAELRHCVDPLTGYKHPLSPTSMMLIGYGLLLLIIPFLCKRLFDSFIVWRHKDNHLEQ